MTDTKTCAGPRADGIIPGNVADRIGAAAIIERV